MADYAELEKLEKKNKQQPVMVSSNQSPTQEGKQGAANSDLKKEPSIQSKEQSTRRFTKQSTKQSIEPNDNDIVAKPRGFYITYRLDNRLNEAVDYLQKYHGIKKVDRSILLNAMLDTEEQWTDGALDKLVDPILSILTNRLLS